MGTFREPRARAPRRQRLWVCFWCGIGAALVVLAITVAHDAAVVLVSGFLAHPHS